MIERAWAHRICIEEVQELVVLKDKLRTAEKTIQSLKNTVDKYGQEARELRSKLSVSKA